MNPYFYVFVHVSGRWTENVGCSVSHSGGYWKNSVLVFQRQTLRSEFLSFAGLEMHVCILPPTYNFVILIHLCKEIKIFSAPLCLL